MLLGICGLLFFHALGRRDLWGSHEARAAQNAQRMLDDGAWGLPRLFDDRYDFQKPPMFYWLAAIAGWTNGGQVDAFAVRLPAAFAATACVLLIFLVMRRRGRPFAGFVAALVLATAQHFTWLARTARIDMPLTLAVTVAVLAVSMTRRWKWLGFIAMAVGILLKGPVGLVLPLAVLACDFLASRWAGKNPSPGPSPKRGGEKSFTPLPASGRGRGRGSAFVWGLPLVLLLAAPWFVWATVRTHGEFFRVFFIHHNVQRAMGGAEALAVHPWWYYGPRLLVDALPWSLLFVPAALWLVRNGRWRRDQEVRLGLVWLLAVILVLSCAKFKRSDYLLPAYPGLALLLGCAAERFWQVAGTRVRRVTTIALAATVAATIVIWVVTIHVEMKDWESEREQRTFAAEIRTHAPKPAVILFFRTEAHLLAFHLGRPVNTFLEWENLDVWAGRPGPHYVVMTPECATEWRRHVTAGELEEVCRNFDRPGGHEKPLILMRTRPRTETRDAAPREQNVGGERSVERSDSGAQPGDCCRRAAGRMARVPEVLGPTVRDSADR